MITVTLVVLTIENSKEILDLEENHRNTITLHTS